ncbi:hypothetical protein [Nocardia gamkensis]|uniref:Uncharacterized protein n=1 Tax=Nocardia gamkensis TaxID=352869 RepID=A0A7X6R3Q1_9NOCA|nr:hypothetical protein [Nocardia gamkensis]NKY27699.1 hypothetical protein [Nocardia gamkensis]
MLEKLPRRTVEAAAAASLRSKAKVMIDPVSLPALGCPSASRRRYRAVGTDRRGKAVAHMTAMLPLVANVLVVAW